MIKVLLLFMALLVSSPAVAQAPAVSQSWFPQGRTSLSATGVTGNVALPSAGLILNVCNSGANDAYLNFGTSNSVTATTTAGFLLKAGFCQAYSRQGFGTTNTFLAGITASSTTTIYIESGTGTPFSLPRAVYTGGIITLGPSQNNIGNVGGKTVSVCVTPTVTTSNSYGTNYVVGGKLTFANAFTSTGSGILQGVIVTMGKVETNGFTFVPFNSDPSASTWTDAAVANINATDIPKQRNPVGLSANSQLGTTTVAGAVGIGEALAPGTTTLYGLLIANAALTNQFTSTTSVQVCIKILQDL